MLIGDVLAVGPVQHGDPDDPLVFSRVVVHGLLLESQSYTRNGNRNNSVVRTREGQLLFVKNFFSVRGLVWARAVRLECREAFEFASRICQLSREDDVVVPVLDVVEGPLLTIARGLDLFLLDFSFSAEVS